MRELHPSPSRNPASPDRRPTDDCRSPGSFITTIVAAPRDPDVLEGTSSQRDAAERKFFISGDNRMDLLPRSRWAIHQIWTGSEMGNMLLTRRDRGMVALAIVLDVAFHSGGETVVNAAELAERTGMARRTLEPLLQALSRERLLDSTRGPHGGYRLGRPARLIKVSEAITVGLNSLEESVHDLSGQLHRIVIEPLWGEFDAALLALAESLTIEDLLKRAAKAGLRKPVTDPLNFVI
jgi:Rrf2 family iron-sulfur cluster assembly transcriptional regulator